MNESRLEQSLRAARNHTLWSSVRKAEVRHLIATRISSPPSSVRTFWWRFVVAPVAALGFALFGTAAAAERSLPGDVLYPMKVAVNEPVMAALAPTPEKKAALAVAFAERRLAEADTLSESGRMNEPEAVALGIEDQSRSAAAAIRSLTRAGKPDAATALRERLARELERRIDVRKKAAFRAAPEVDALPEEAEDSTGATLMALPASAPVPAPLLVASSSGDDSEKESIEVDDAEARREAPKEIENRDKSTGERRRAILNNNDQAPRPERLERAIRRALEDLDHED